MILTRLLIIIYISFISLGLPDSLLGSAWPSISRDLGAALSGAGVISMTIAGGTIVSSLLSDRVIRRFGTGPVTACSVLMTAVALLGSSLSGSFFALVLWAVPLGLGAGAVDAALNSFVALHYRAKHMNWLHCFWGVGASVGPVILSLCLVYRGRWQLGYRVISILQFALAAVLLLSLPLWRRAGGERTGGGDRTGQVRLGPGAIARLPGAKPALATFFCYCALEATVGLWGSSYLAAVRQVSPETAASWIALYYLGITAGRLCSGFLSVKLANRQMVRLGQLLIGLGAALLLIPLPRLSMAALPLIGLGCAPIYPSLLHETPVTFGSGHAQAMMGVQMASAYAGTTLMPPLFGLIGGGFGYGLFPLYIGALLALMAVLFGRTAK